MRFLERLKWRWEDYRFDRAQAKAIKAARSEAEKQADQNEKVGSKLKAFPASMAKKMKEKLLAASKLLDTLTAIDPFKLAAALGPALAATAMIGGVAYAVANEVEDGRQADRSEIVQVEGGATIESVNELRELIPADPATQTELTELIERIDQLETRVEQVDPQLVTELADRLNTTDEVITQILNEIPGLDDSAAIRDVLNRIPIVPEPVPPVDISGIEDDVTELRSDVDVNAAGIANNDDNINTNADGIAANIGDIVENADDIANTEADIANLQAETLALAVVVDDLETNVAALPDTDTLQDAVSGLQTQIDGLPTVDAVALLEATTEALIDAQAEAAVSRDGIADSVAVLQPLVDRAQATGEDAISAVEAVDAETRQRLTQIQAQIASIQPFDPADLQAADEATQAAVADQLAAIESIQSELDALPDPFDPAALEAAQAAIATRVSAVEDALDDVGSPFDPTALETEIAAVRNLTERAIAQQDAIQTELDATAAALAIIEDVFYADLVSQFGAGRELETVVTNGCNGANIFQLPGGELAATNNTPGTLQEHCYQVRALPPTLPAACTFPGAGSLALTVDGEMTLTAVDGASSGLNSVVIGEFVDGPGYLSIAIGPGETQADSPYNGFTFAPKNLVWDADRVTFRITAFLNYEIVGTGNQPRIGTAGPVPVATLVGTLACNP